jgi:hypothetical protein
MALEISYTVLEVGGEAVTVAVGDGAVDLTKTFSADATQGWQRVSIALACFEQRGANTAAVTEPLVISSAGPLTLQLGSARIVASSGNTSCESAE